MNLKKFGLKVLSVAIAVVMLVSVCAPAILAVTEEEDTPKYVSLGASNVNGYGLHGYIPVDMDAAALDANLKMQANVFGCGVETPGSYPVLVAEALGADLTQLAMSSMRAEELRFLLDDTYTGDAYTDWRFCDTEAYPNQNSANWFVGAGKLFAGDDTLTNDEAVAALREAYQNAIAEADYITVDIGVNNFGVYVSGKLSDPNSKWENDLSLIDPALAADYAEGKAYVKELIAQYVPEIDTILADMPLDVDDLTDTLAYALVGFCTNFDVIMEKIHELNPDATVVAVSIQNLMAGLELALPGMDPAPFGDLFGALVNAANIYIAVGSPYADQYYCADVRQNGGRVEFFADDISKYNGDPRTLSQNIIECLDVLDGFEANYNKGIHVKYQLHKFLNSEWETLAGAQVAGVYTTFESFMAAGAEDFAGLAETEYASFIPTLQGMYAEFSVKYDAMLYAAYDVVASIFQAGANTTVLDFGGLAFMGDIEDVLAEAIFSEMAIAVEAAMNDTAYDYELSETFFADVAAYANAVADAELVTEAHIATVAAFAVRTSVGNSFFGHPSPEGHQTLATKILAAIANKTTGADIAIAEFTKIIEDAVAYIIENHEKIYADAYDLAVDAGYIAEAEAVLRELQADISGFVYDDSEISAELKALIDEAIVEVNEDITALIAIINADEHSKAVVSFYALLDELSDDLVVLEALAKQAGIDYYPVLKAKYEEVKAKLIEEFNKAVEELYAKYEAALVVLKEMICEAAAKYGDKAYAIIVEASIKVENLLSVLRERIEEVYGIVIDANATVEEIIAAIRNHIAKITMGEYTVSDDSYYIAIDGEGYADILADALNLTPDQFNAVAWDEVTFEEIAKADFITVGYDDSSVVAFTTEQFLGYAKAYLDGTLRTDVESYIDDALSAIFAADVMAEIKDGVNSAIDSVVASEMLADKEVVALDWAALVGAENVARIDEIRADIKASLVNAGVPAVAEIEINVVETLYEYGFNAFTKEFLYNNLGENAYYTVEIPVLDLAVFTAESALYEKVRYNANYSQTILAINKINPDATVAVLGNYDIFDGISLGIDKITGETTIPVTELLGLEEIPGIIEAIVAQIPAGDDLVLELGDLADMEVYEVEIPVAELVDFAVEKYNALVSYVETVEIPVTNENVALLLDYAKKTWAEVEPEYNAFVADVMAKLEKASEVGVYTVEIPVGAIIDYAVDTYDYLVDLFALLADVDYTVDDVTVSVTVDLAGAYEALVELSSIHPLAYAVLFENVFFVDVSDVETNFEAIVADGDILTYILCCIDNIEMIAPSAAGNEYIAAQILKALVVTCDHVYDDCADVDCNRCGELREAPGHTSDTDCDVCGYHAHANGVKQNGQAATCTVDGWNDYYVCSCGKFFADAACTEEIADLEAWKVGAGKIVAAHNYGDLVPAVDEKHTATELVAGVAAHYQCSVCETYFTADKVETTLEALTGATPSHVFGSWITDEEKHWKECSCGLKTEEGAHVDADNDDKCDTCAKALATGPDSGTTLPAHTHSFGDWVTDDQNHWKVCSCGEKSELGEHKDADNDGKCDVCKADMTSEDSEEGLSTGATVAIVVGSSVVVAIGGFSLVWFVFCKKSWLDLVAIFKR